MKNDCFVSVDIFEIFLNVHVLVNTLTKLMQAINQQAKMRISNLTAQTKKTKLERCLPYLIPWNMENILSQACRK